MKLSLFVQSAGKMQGKSIAITRPEFFIGRDPKCQLRPASPSVSKRHCALLVRHGKVYLRDFNSTNGTLVNQNRIQGDVELHNGDQIKVGPVEFTVRIETADAAPAPEFLAPFMGGVEAETTEFILPPEAAGGDDEEMETGETALDRAPPAPAKGARPGKGKA